MFVVFFMSCSSTKVTPKTTIGSDSVFEQTQAAKTVGSALHCATRHQERPRGVRLNSKEKEIGLSEEIVAVHIVFHPSVSGWTARLRYGELYHPDRTNNIEREIQVESFEYTSTTISWSGDLDASIPSNIRQSSDFIELGGFSMSLKGQSGFYIGEAKFAVSDSAIPVSCWGAEIENQYHYLEGRCINNDGTSGQNPWTLEMIRETKNGECSNLDKHQLNEYFMDYPNLDWDLRGATLDRADVVFSNMKGARLEGTDFQSMTFGYVQIDGTADSYTQAPEACRISGFNGSLTVRCSN